MKYAHYDETTRQILGWYDDGIHKEIPIPNVEVEDTAWQNAIDNNHNKINKDGTTSLFDFRTEEEVLVEANKAKQQEAKSYLDSTDWIKSKYVELVAMKKTMTEEEFNLKYEGELAKMDEARGIL